MSDVDVRSTYTVKSTLIPYGTIHLRRRHILGGGVKNLPNLPMDSSKKCRRRGVGVKNSENLPTS